jgi:hypothetical protein
MKKILSIGVVFCLTSVLFTFIYSFAEERITLTTYYPAPYGVYRELRADMMAIGSAYRNVPLVNGRLLVEGAVGIGTTNPSATLEVLGDVNIPVSLIRFDAGTNAGTAGIGLTDTGRIFGEHNVGVETSRLVMQIQDNSNDELIFRVGNVGPVRDIIKASFTNVSIAETGGNVFLANGGGNVRLATGGGNVGIGGTTATAHRLMVIGSIHTGAAEAGGGGNLASDGYDLAGFQVGTSTLYSYDAICAGNGWGNCGSSGGVTISADNTVPGTASTALTPTGNSWISGNLGIGTTAPQAKLDVRGTSNTCVRISYTAASTTNCPANYWITLFSTAEYQCSSIPQSGYFMCCKACLDNDANGICEGP